MQFGLLNASSDQILNEVWAQMKVSLDEDFIFLQDSDVVARHLDPAIKFGPGGTPIDNAEPLLVPTVNLFSVRPDAKTKVPNLFLASDYVKTTTDLPTMEGANEAARRAVNGILDLTGSTAARAKLFTFDEPSVFAWNRTVDGWRYAFGPPNTSPSQAATRSGWSSAIPANSGANSGSAGTYLP